MTERADAFVFFGATGDLAKKMIFPALYRLVRTGRLDIPVIGVAFSGWDADRLKQRVTESVAQHGGIDDRAALESLLSLVRYVDGDYSDAGTFQALRTQLGASQHPVHYLAIPPKLFASVVRQLDESDCARDGRVVVEKPFGHDLASAQQLNAVLRTVFDEDAIYRTDHFLGEEALLNVLYLRMANSVVEALFDRRHVTRVQITMAEDFGVEDRGGFYDGVGCLLDVVENHVFQIVSLLTMDPPAIHAPDALRQAQAQVFASIRPLDPADVVRGQYEGYRSIPGVQPDSDVETFVALRLFIDSYRWARVPILIRAGKRLPITATEAVVEFAEPPLDVLPTLPVPPGRVHLRFRFSPDPAVALSLRVLAPRRTPPRRPLSSCSPATSPSGRLPTSGCSVRRSRATRPSSCARTRSRPAGGSLQECSRSTPRRCHTSQAPGDLQRPLRWLNPADGSIRRQANQSATRESSGTSGNLTDWRGRHG